MRFTKIAYTVSLLIVGLGIPMSGNCQVYTLSTPITGYMTMSAQDLNGPSGSYGSFTFTLTNLAETVYLDPVAQTIRQVGVISGTPTATHISIQETQSIPGQFPNPPTNVSGTLTVTLAPASGSLSFDTGLCPLTWTPASSAYTCNGFLPSFTNFEGSCSLVTGGQTYSNSFTYELANRGVLIFNTVSTTNYPNSLSLGGLRVSPNPTYLTSWPSVVTTVTAANGFQAALSVGLHPASAHEEYFSWASPGTITATLVPTTNSPTITSQPQSVVVHAHDTALFTVCASGTIPLSYQWSFNGTDISGATLSSFAIPNVVQTNVGTYAVIVTNGVGSVTSSNAVLSMYPFINVPFAGASTYWGKDATFNVQAWGAGPLNYQWFKDGSAILNATNETFILTSIQATNAGLYSVVVSSSLGSVTNLPAQVAVYPAGVSLGLYPGITIDGVVGYNYTIRRTTDLSNTNAWVTMTNLTLAQPVELWVDTNVDASLPANPKHVYEVLPGQ